MAVYKGVEGIRKLRDKVAAQTKALVSMSAIGVADLMIENSPVGDALYQTNDGFYVKNIAGDFKNSWNVSFDSPDTSIRSPDISGSGAFSDAISTAQSYSKQHTLFITNNMPYASNVEDGWDSSDPIRVEYGWGDKDGYHVVAYNKGRVLKLLKDSAIKAANVSSEDDIF